MTGLTEINGIGPSLAAAFVKNKYLTIADVAAAKPAELSSVPGINVKRARQIIASAKSLLANASSRKVTQKKPVKPVAPLKTGGISGAKSGSDTGKTTKAKKSKNDKKSTQKEKIRKLKKTIKKLKKQKKKIVAKDKKKAKRNKSKNANKK